MASQARPLRRMHVKRNDNVLILAGKSKGRTGRVLRVLPAEGRVIVEGVNFVRKHTRANPQKNIKGGILEREAPVDASNLMVVCGECGKPSRVGRRVQEDGHKVRICRRCDGVLDK
ncbi:MAG TPA: 50S ribosomal protein L24 [Candidatus Polarisedimenticolia bacterium]|nr:50S ribosomal protein L24 [Candidatus Polarisedimenticolia bacterium]